MNSIELANKIHKARDDFYKSYNRFPSSVAVYVSYDQHMRLKMEIGSCHYMHAYNPYEFMGYPLYPVYDTDKPHPDVRISFE